MDTAGHVKNKYKKRDGQEAIAFCPSDALSPLFYAAGVMPAC